MKKYLATLGAAMLVFGLSAETLKPTEWVGTKGNATEPPKVTLLASQDNDDEPKEGEETIGALATVGVDGDFQGLQANFAKAVPLSKYRGIAFDVKQSFYHTTAALVLSINGRYISVETGEPDEWQHVEVMFDDPKWNGKVANVKAKKIGFYGYAEVNKVDETLAIANLELLEKE